MAYSRVQEIETLRVSLNESVQRLDILDKEVISLSQELDELILLEQKSKADC
ncbi:aspartyl-phosphate phosphatase Spo0E family protein [Longirhabdus pacifica]|uniref:aspartyl-phosphate phosphatase Spo0E family protein n=1 Tax=Longirhabdus pacifica TaxID=2305227 RepID=UPI001008F963